MRIIKQGREPKKEIELTCKRCGCEFAYSKEDVKFDPYDHNGEYCYVECPFCGKIIEAEYWSEF